MEATESESQGLVIQSLRSDFGLQVSDLRPVENDGYHSEIYMGKATEGDIVVKVALTKNSFPVEIWGATQFEQHDVPVPVILGYQECPSHIQKPTLVMMKATGKSLKDIILTPEQEENIFKEAGEILKRVHEIKVDGFGRLIQNGDTFRGRYNSWKEQLESQWQKNEANKMAERGFITESDLEITRSVFKELASVEIPQTVFVYEDLHKSHIFTDGEKITDVIDLGNALAGDPWYDIAMSLFFQTPNQRQAFIQGYGELARDPLVNKYLLYIAAIKVSLRGIKNNAEGLQIAKQTFNKTLSELISSSNIIC